MKSEHFEVREVADGVYGIIEKREAMTGSNAGIIDLGDRTMVFDTLLNIEASEDLKKAARYLTGRDADYVVNSHGHFDHIVGNQVFGDMVQIISTLEARAELVKDKEAFEKGEVVNEAMLADVKAQLEVETDPYKLLDLNNDLLYLINLLKPGIKLRLPNLTVKGVMTIQGSKRQVKLVALGKTHSTGDMYAWLPEDKVCFTGDLLFSKMHPWLGAGDPMHFIGELEKLSSMELDWLIPGHGEVSTTKDIQLQIGYIQAIIKLVKDHPEWEVPQFDIRQLPEIYWDWFGTCFVWNIDFLKKYLLEKK